MKPLSSRICSAGRLLLAASMLPAACAAFAQNAADPIVGLPGDTIVFDRFCAEEEDYQLRAFAIMESEDRAARALVRIVTGYFSPSNPEVSIGAQLLELALDGGAAWSSTDFSLQLLADDGQRESASLQLDQYHSSMPGGMPVSVPFVADTSGRLQWRNFAEPGAARTGDDERFNFTDGFALDAGELGLGDAAADIGLGLRLRRIDGGAEILLAGPSIRIPDVIREMAPPEFETLGLLETFNPFQRGGVFDWLGRGFKYRNCIDERMQARLLFLN